MPRQETAARTDRLKRRGSGPSRADCVKALLAALLCTAAAAVVVRESVTVFSAGWSTAPLREQLNDWAQDRQAWTQEDWDVAEQTLQQAIALTPQDTVVQDQLAQLYALRGRKEWTTGEPGSPEVGWYVKAAEVQQRSIDLRPLNAIAWANLAVSQSAASLPLEQVFATWRRAHQLGPLEPEVNAALQALVLRYWDEAPADAVAWMEQREPGVRARLLREEAARQQQAQDAVEAAAAEEAASAAAATRRAAIEAAAARAKAAGY